MMQISEPNQSAKNGFALFALAFRPFFLLAGLSATILIGLWIYSYSQGHALVTKIPGLYWHGHEMIFGYSAAVVAGFLLTAVRNWTGVQTLRGSALLFLTLIWLLARVLLFTSLDLVWLVLIDFIFLPLVAAAVACPIIKARQWKNLFFVGLILLYAVANGLFHAELLWGLESGVFWGLRTGLGVVLIIITVMAGRVVGFFIERGLNQRIKDYTWANRLALWGTVLYVAGQFILQAPVLIVIALLAAAGHAGRAVGWYHVAIWRTPLLWVLYLGYFWMTAGFVLAALVQSGLVIESIAIHAFTVGVIGIMTMGMMARVALGHTGRELQTSGLLNIAFVLINIAAFVRVVLPALAVENASLWIDLAAVLWIAAFALFSMLYLPILVKPRVDGQAG